MISERYRALIEEQSELTLGLMALCDCNRLFPAGRPKTWAYDESLPWPRLRARIRELDDLRKAELAK